MAAIVEACTDRLHGEALWERFNAGGEAQRWYLRALADGFAGVSDSPMVDDLQAAVGELEARVAAGAAAGPPGAPFTP